MTLVWLSMFAAAEAEPRLWGSNLDKLAELGARGWTSTDLSLKTCGQRDDGLNVCRYSLFSTAEVFAFANKDSNAIDAVSIKCSFSKCSSETFRVFSVYLMRSTNDDTDDVLTILLASAFAKKIVITDGMIFMAYKDEDSYNFVMKLNS